MPYGMPAVIEWKYCIEALVILKPQDSFGDFDTPSDLSAIVWNDILNCNIAQWQIIIMYLTYWKVFGS